MSEPLKVIGLRQYYLSADRARWCEEITVGSSGNHGWFAWFVWEGGYYLALTLAAGAESEVGDAPAGAVAYARTLWELER